MLGLKPNLTVTLVVDEGGKRLRVGTAVLMPNKDEGNLGRILHGSELKGFARKGEDLVSIRRSEIFAQYKNLRYPYKFGGVEGPPGNLGGMHLCGMYAWDANMMELPGQSSGQDVGGVKRPIKGIRTDSSDTPVRPLPSNLHRPTPTAAATVSKPAPITAPPMKQAEKQATAVVEADEVELVKLIKDTSIDLTSYITRTVQVSNDRIRRPKHKVRSLDAAHKSELHETLTEQGILGSVGNLSVTVERKGRALDELLKEGVLICDCILIDGNHRLEVFSVLRGESDTWKRLTDLLNVTVWLRPDGKDLTRKEVLSIGNKLNRIVSNVLPMSFASRVHSTVSFIMSSIEDDGLRLEQMNPHSVAESMDSYGTLGKYDNRTLRRYADIGLRLARSPKLVETFERMCEKAPKMGLTHLSDDRLYKLDESGFEFCVECVQALLGRRRGGSESAHTGRFEDMRGYFFTYALQLHSYCNEIAEEKELSLPAVFAREMNLSAAEKTSVRAFLVVQLAKLEPSANDSLWQAKLSRKLTEVKKKLDPLFQMKADDSVKNSRNEKKNSQLESGRAKKKVAMPSDDENTGVRKSKRVNKGKRPQSDPVDDDNTESKKQRKVRKRKRNVTSTNAADCRRARKIARHAGDGGEQVQETYRRMQEMDRGVLMGFLKEMGILAEWERANGREGNNFMLDDDDDDDDDDDVHVHVHDDCEAGAAEKGLRSDSQAEGVANNVGPFDDLNPICGPPKGMKQPEPYTGPPNPPWCNLAKLCPSVWPKDKNVIEHVQPWLDVLHMPSGHRSTCLTNEELKNNHHMVFWHAAKEKHLALKSTTIPIFGCVLPTKGNPRTDEEALWMAAKERDELALEFFGEKRRELEHRGFCILESFATDEGVPHAPNDGDVSKNLLDWFEENFKEQPDLRVEANRVRWNPIINAGSSLDDENRRNGIGRFMTTRAGIVDELECKEECEWVVRRRALLDARLGQIACALRLSDNLMSTEKMHGPVTGGRVLCTSIGCPRQTLHTDFRGLKKRERNSNKNPGYFTITSGRFSFPLWVCENSHRIVFGSHRRMRILSMSMEVKKVRIPPFSVFFGRGDVWHAGGSYEDGYMQRETFRYHMYLVPKGYALPDAVHRRKGFTPRFSCEDDVTMEEVDGDGIVEEILEEGDEEVENESEISDDDASLDVGEY